MNQLRRLQSKSILALIAFHLITGLVLGWFAEDYGPVEPLLAIYIGFLFGQVSLLSTWSGVSILPWTTRLAGFTIGTFYLSVQFCFSLEDWDPKMILLVVGPAVLMAVVMALVGRFVGTLQSLSEPMSKEAEAMQFSILQLMLVTTIVGTLLSVGQLLRPYLGSSSTLMELCLLCGCFISAGLVAVWAMLGRSYVLVRSLIAMFVSWVAGYICGIWFSRGDYWFMLMLFSLQTLTVLGTLFLVRQIGYRLIRNQHPGTTSTGSA